MLMGWGLPCLHCALNVFLLFNMSYLANCSKKQSLVLLQIFTPRHHCLNLFNTHRLCPEYLSDWINGNGIPENNPLIQFSDAFNQVGCVLCSIGHKRALNHPLNTKASSPFVSLYLDWLWHICGRLCCHKSGGGVPQGAQDCLSCWSRQMLQLFSHGVYRWRWRF